MSCPSGPITRKRCTFIADQHASLPIVGLCARCSKHVRSILARYHTHSQVSHHPNGKSTKGSKGHTVVVPTITELFQNFFCSSTSTSRSNCESSEGHHRSPVPTALAFCSLPPSSPPALALPASAVSASPLLTASAGLSGPGSSGAGRHVARETTGRLASSLRSCSHAPILRGSPGRALMYRCMYGCCVRACTRLTYGDVEVRGLVLLGPLWLVLMRHFSCLPPPFLCKRRYRGQNLCYLCTSLTKQLNNNLNNNNFKLLKKIMVPASVQLALEQNLCIPHLPMLECYNSTAPN
jgi:hypothetical protein